MHGNAAHAAARRPRRKRAFLHVLADTVNVARACRKAGIPRRTVYHWRDADPDFAREWDDALEDGIDLLEAELHRRAFEGVEKPVWHKGEQVGTTRCYSDALAMFLLKAHRPERYRDNYRPPEADRFPRSDAAAGQARSERVEDDDAGFEMREAPGAPDVEATTTATVTGARAPNAATTSAMAMAAGTAATATAAGASGTGARAPAFPPSGGGGMNGAGGDETRDPSHASRRRTSPADEREPTRRRRIPGTDSETCWTPSSRRRSRSPRSRSVSAASSGGSRAPGRGWS